MLKTKKLIIILVVVIIFFIIFFIKNHYKNLKIGNNMTSKSIEEIEEYILNISSYEAKISVTVESNKNINKYVLSQKYEGKNKYRQIVLEPSNIEGIEILYDEGKLRINNSKLNANTIYENYNYIVNNCLCLESFILDYRENNGRIYEENNEIILETKTSEGNQYIYNKKLYIDKETGNITKLLIKDINEKTIVYILYNEIKINDFNKNDVLAFKQNEPHANL